MTNKKPHIVKFSGGRSSAMMLMKLLENNQLDPKRGDVIIFNNTSAEHSATYKFTKKIQKIAEEKHNIPFFWIEYQTYEDCSGTYQWSRKPTYRLVNNQPFSEQNKNGYRYKGEVFESLISHTGYVPNMLSRTCTLSMKIFTTNSFLSDWFAQKQSIERLGHYGSTSKITDDYIINTHKKNGGGVPASILLPKKEYVRQSAVIREQQSWMDFTQANIVIDNEALKAHVIGNKAQLHGDLALSYISYLGIRKDEEIRIKKIKARIAAAQGQNSLLLENQPNKENVIAPLVDSGVIKQNVIAFWHKQPFNLDLPDNGLFSNCVYCPLKGKAKLLEIAKTESNKQQELTPESIDWWIKIENKYSRDLIAEKRNPKKNHKFVGFFGAVDSLVYPKIKDNAEKIETEFLEDEDYIPCNCTD